MSHSMTIARKKMPPLKRKGEFQEKKEDEVKENQEKFNQEEIENFNKKQEEQLQKGDLDVDQENLPEILRKSDNPQMKINYQRMRLRNFTDGAVSINLQIDDLSNENLELYDHKGINIEATVINEKIIDVHEAYIESLHQQKYFKINPVKKPEINEKKKIIMPKKEENYNTLKQKQVFKEQNRRTEDDIYDKFDRELQEVIENVSNKISIFFLFCKGLLAGNLILKTGICLTNLFLLFEVSTLASFLSYYSLFAKEIFNFMYIFTFISLIGNGVKFLNSYKNCKYLITIR